jgi:hypothetical protein
MTKKLKAVKTTAVFALVLLSIFSTIYAVSAETQEQEQPGLLPVFKYNSQLNVEYDSNALNQPLEIDKVTNVKINATYSTNLPQMAGNIYGRFLLFGSFVLFPPQVHFEVVKEKSSVADWADISFDSPDILPNNIPLDGKVENLRTVHLQISPRREAPAEPQTITIKASVDGIRRRVIGYETELNIKFEPAYVPEIEVYVDKPVRFSGPRESLDFKITVKNKANKATTVIADISSVDPDWAPIINPTRITLLPNGQEIITFSVVSPYGFGWHDETVSMNLKFTPYPSPISSASDSYSLNQGQIVDAQVRINNRGFSGGGFEFVFLALIVLIILVLIFMLRKKK